MKPIRLNLSKKSVRRAIEKTRATQEQMKELADVISKRLAQEAVLAAQTSLSNSGRDISEEFYKSISYQQTRSGMWRIFSTSDHAAYVEFGTGPVGAANPHPKASGNYKGEGWYTKADGKNMEAEYGWKPITAKDGTTIYYTTGQPSHHFMYDGYKHIQKKEVVDRIVAECIKEAPWND